VEGREGGSDAKREPEKGLEGKEGRKGRERELV